MKEIKISFKELCEEALALLKSNKYYCYCHAFSAAVYFHLTGDKNWVGRMDSFQGLIYDSVKEYISNPKNLLGRHKPADNPAFWFNSVKTRIIILEEEVIPDIGDDDYFYIPTKILLLKDGQETSL